MLRHENRILFLKEFTKELILNSKTNEGQFAEIISEDKIKNPAEIPISPIMPAELKPFLNPRQISRQLPMKRIPLKLMAKPIAIKQAIRPQIMQGKKLSEIEPLPSSIPSGFSLNKIDFLIQDPRVTIIECPGPEKFVITRTAGRTAMTKLSLNNQEIQSIIEKFANAAKIPIISGLFKAAVGNLVITAVVSDIAGNRFIITKITPRFIIEQQAQGY